MHTIPARYSIRQIWWWLEEDNKSLYKRKMAIERSWSRREGSAISCVYVKDQVAVGRMDIFQDSGTVLILSADPHTTQPGVLEYFSQQV